MRWLCLLAMLLAGCRLYPVAPAARVKRDPSVAAPRTILAEKVICFADDPEITPCDDGYVLAVANAARMELEYAGFSIVEGPRWSELAARGQPELLRQAGVDGTLFSSVTLGAPQGMGQRRVTVALALRRASDDATAWTTDCVVGAGQYHTVERAIELATRCAVESSSLW